MAGITIFRPCNSGRNWAVRGHQASHFIEKMWLRPGNALGAINSYSWSCSASRGCRVLEAADDGNEGARVVTPSRVRC